MKTHYFIIFLIFSYVNYSLSCPNDCSNHGNCENGVCYCEWFYQGEACDVRKVNSGFEPLWFCYVAFTVLVNLILIVIEVYELRRVGSLHKNMLTIVLVCLVVASVGNTPKYLILTDHNNKFEFLNTLLTRMPIWVFIHMDLKVFYIFSHP